MSISVNLHEVEAIAVTPLPNSVTIGLRDHNHNDVTIFFMKNSTQAIGSVDSIAKALRHVQDLLLSSVIPEEEE